MNYFDFIFIIIFIIIIFVFNFNYLKIRYYSTLIKYFDQKNLAVVNLEFIIIIDYCYYF